MEVICIIRTKTEIIVDNIKLFLLVLSVKIEATVTRRLFLVSIVYKVNYRFGGRIYVILL